MSYDAPRPAVPQQQRRSATGSTSSPAPASGSSSSRRRPPCCAARWPGTSPKRTCSPRAGACPPARQVFTDVPCSDPDARHVKLVYEKGITAGCSTNPLQYCPDDDAHPRADGRLPRQGLQARRLRAARPARARSRTSSCSGAYATFAPWIEQLYRDGVTARLRREPAALLPRQHRRRVGNARLAREGARRGARDPVLERVPSRAARRDLYSCATTQNRIVTEMAGGSSGASTATLSVTRDNVFLGNLLVASYVASPAGWQYTTSDHLGSPRVVFNQSRPARREPQVLALRRRHHGDSARPAPRLRADGERRRRRRGSTTTRGTHDHGLGRFLSPGSRRRDAGESAELEPVCVHAEQPDEARGSGWEC